MKTYEQAITELRAMVAWLKVSNGAFQYLRVADCHRFVERQVTPWTQQTQVTEKVENLAHSLWTYGALSFTDQCDGGYGLDDISKEQAEAFLDLARNVLTDCPTESTPTLLEALLLAEATIERLNRHDSANGTLEVLRAAIALATPDKD